MWSPPSAPKHPPRQSTPCLVEEVKIGCTLGMLQCLDAAHRAAYILGEIMEVSGLQAAEVLRISAALLRKQLQKARGRHAGISPELLRTCIRRRPVPVQPANPGRTVSRPYVVPIVAAFHRDFIRGVAGESAQGGRGSQGARGTSHQPACCRVGGLRPEAGRRP